MLPDNDRPSGASWVNPVGHALINPSRSRSGARRLTSTTVSIAHLNELTQTAPVLGYNHMIGNVPTLTQPPAVAAGSGVTTQSQPRRCMYPCSSVLLKPWSRPTTHCPAVPRGHTTPDFRPKSELKNSRGAYVPATDHDQYGFEGDSGFCGSTTYLDTEERPTVRVTHEYLIDQLRPLGPETVKSKNENAKLNFNHLQ
jgi:hypothetical protein